MKCNAFNVAITLTLVVCIQKVLSDYFSTFGVRDWERTDVINADRTNMCRYPNREDDGYDKVRNAIGFHLAVKRSKAKEGVCRERSSVGPSNVENTANWRESDASTVIFDCNGLSRQFYLNHPLRTEKVFLEYFH